MEVESIIDIISIIYYKIIIKYLLSLQNKTCTNQASCLSVEEGIYFYEVPEASYIMHHTILFCSRCTTYLARSSAEIRDLHFWTRTLHLTKNDLILEINSKWTVPHRMEKKKKKCEIFHLFFQQKPPTTILKIRGWY